MKTERKITEAEKKRTERFKEKEADLYPVGIPHDRWWRGFSDRLAAYTV